MENVDAKKWINKMTLDEWFELWISKYKTNITITTKSGYINAYKNISDGLGYMDIKKIVAGDFIDLFNDLIEFGNKKSTVKQTKMVIKQCMEAAVDSGLLVKNPVPKKFVTYGIDSKNSVLTIYEQKQLLDYVISRDLDIKELVVFLLTTGLRSAEARSLNWDDIDFENDHIIISKSLREYHVDRKRIHEINRPKTKRSNRIVPLNNYSKKYLLQQSEKLMEIEYDTYVKYGELVFPHNGKIMTQNDIYYLFSKLCKEMNDNGYNIRRVTPHMLRHTFCTRCFESGMEVKVISEILGHASIKTTLDIYTKPSNEFLATEIQKLKPIGAKLAQTPMSN